MDTAAPPGIEFMTRRHFRAVSAVASIFACTGGMRTR